MMQVLPKELRGGVAHVVRSGELQKYTEMGWQLVAVVTANEVQTVTREVRCDRMPSGNGQCPRHLIYIGVGGTCNTSDYVNDGVVATAVPYFVLRKDGTTALEEATAELDRTRQARDEAVKDKQELEKLIASNAKEAELWTQKYMKLSKERNELAAVKDREVSRVHKMEADIAKIRTAIGALRMKEILGQD